MARTVAEKGAGGDVQDVHPVGSGRGDRDLSAVRRQPGELVGASKPSWATVSGDGRDCVISESGADRVSAISFATGRRVATVAVGDHPQRVRIGHVPTDWTAPAG